MLHLVRNNSPYTAVILFILALCLNLKALIHAPLPLAVDSQIVYGAILSALKYIFGKTAFAYSLLAVVLIYIQAIILNAIVNKYRLFNQNNYLVAFMYIVLCSLHPAFSQFNAQIFVNFALLFAINELLQLKQAHSPNKQLFNLGFAISLASLFQFSNIFFLPFLFIALIILRSVNIREWMIALVGFVMPFYILLVVFFCIDKGDLWRLWPNLGISLPSQLKPASYYLGAFTGVFILFVGSMFNMQSIVPKASIYIRRCWITLTIMLFWAVLVAIFTNSHIIGAWMICLPTLALILAHTFINERSKKMNAISFYFALGLAIFCQIFLPL